MLNQNPNISGRLRDLTQNYSGAPNDINDAIVPIIDCTPLGLGKSQTVSGTATNRTDTYKVPSGKYWVLIAGTFVRSNAGTNVAGLIIDGVTYDYEAQTSSTRFTVKFERMKLKAGDSISMDLQAGTSGSLKSFVFYEEYAEA